MKDKILIWIDYSINFFGIAKFLKDSYNCNISTIIESHPKPKIFFQSQKILNFQNCWFFWDHVNKFKKPDINYLLNFEKKYKINLWVIAYSERYFSNYNYYHKFSRKEILSLLEQECKFFEKVLDTSNPDFIIIPEYVFHHLYLFYEICKAKGIKILMLSSGQFQKRWIFKETNFEKKKNPELLDESTLSIIDLKKFLFDNSQFKVVKKYVKTHNPRKMIFNLKSLRNIFSYFFTKDENLNRFVEIGRTKPKIIKKMIPLLIKSQIRERFLNKNSCHVLEKNEKYLYFPLSIEPERNLGVLTPFFPDQLELISKIAKSLPVDYKLYVKEHPVSKTRYWHPIKFYKSLIELPNVRLIHPSVKSEEIISKCSLVTTYAGTSGIEATFYEKPVIVFGNSTYHNDFSSVCKIQDIDELPKLIRKQLKIKPTIEELNNFVKKIKNNSFQYDPDVLMDSHPLNGHLFSNKEISIQKMEFFLQKHKQIFQNLVNELIAKIEQHEKVDFVK